jgi:hypothetical protein
MDPVLSWVVRASLCLLMAAAAVHKAADLPSFAETLRNYRILPARGVGLAVVFVVGVEAAIAIGLLLPQTAPFAAPLCAGLLLVYSAAIGVNLSRGRLHIDCGCLGPRARAGVRQPISPWLLARNGVLVVACLLAALPVGPRPLLWIDGISILCGLLVLALLFQSTNILTVQAPGWSRLRRPS